MTPCFTRPKHRRIRAGFTLVELMVALSGGLSVAIVVFALAKDGSRFYVRESRVADATLSALAGFERLRTDLSRISFLSSPNIRRDPRLCGDPVGDPTWPAGLKRLAGLGIDAPAPTNAALLANKLTPNSLLIAGNLSSTELFPIIGVQANGSGFRVDLQTNIGPLMRKDFIHQSAALQTSMLQDFFLPQGQAGRALRIVDPSGAVQYGTISGVVNDTGPAVLLSGNPALRLRGANSTICGLHALSHGYANVVSFVRYQVRPVDLKAAPGYAPLYSTGGTPWDANRTDLVREELDVTGAQIPGTEEIVSEYAVDLELGITVAQTFNGLNVSQLTNFAPGDTKVKEWAGDIVNVATAQPQRVQALRVRLSVRSREPDRELGITGSAAGPVAPGLYRFSLASDGLSQFARVRTLQADITLHNQLGISW